MEIFVWVGFLQLNASEKINIRQPLKERRNITINEILKHK